MGYRLAIESIVVFRAGERKTFQRGDPLDGVHPSNLQSMIDLKQAITDEEYEASWGGGAVEVKRDWRATTIAELSVSRKLKKAMAEAGFTTVADVLEHGRRHGSLEGFSEADEQAIQAAIEKIAK